MLNKFILTNHNFPFFTFLFWTSLVAQMVKRLPAMQETRGESPGGEDLLEPTPVFLPGESHGRTNLVGYIQSTGSQRVVHDWATSLSLPQAEPLQVHGPWGLLIPSPVEQPHGSMSLWFIDEHAPWCRIELKLHLSNKWLNELAVYNGRIFWVVHG